MHVLMLVSIHEHTFKRLNVKYINWLAKSSDTPVQDKQTVACKHP